MAPDRCLLSKMTYKVVEYTKPGAMHECIFEDIYFARPNSVRWGRQIAAVRKDLGKFLAPKLAPVIKEKLDLCLITYVPNTAKHMAQGLMEGIEDLVGKISFDIEGISKDAKGRTFIYSDDERAEIGIYSYDPFTSLEGKAVIIGEDSIVRGTTLKQSIIPALIRGNAREIYVVSSSPQIRYPCCYGIDMSQIGKFIAFEAVMGLCNVHGLQPMLEKICAEAKNQQEHKKPKNLVDQIYSQFNDSEICEEISRMITPADNKGVGVHVIYSDVESLFKAKGSENICTACFDGRYPTSGGYRVLNNSLINYFEGRHDIRSY